MQLDNDHDELPLSGVRVVEFSHMVMGPSTGVILADLGAEVIKVEPIGGDRTRQLLGSGSGYFSMFNRNKRSISIDLKSKEGIEIAKELVNRSDVLIENFRPGALVKLGLGPEVFSTSNPGLVYYSAKGFLNGPYQKRAALDEVAQMMGGLAYMTGPPGRPLRAGASVIDITGGMFGVIGILAALQRRVKSGVGGNVCSSLFETTSFMVGQHIAQMAVTGVAPNPMPERSSAWAIYDVFETSSPGEQVFVGVVSDSQWEAFTSTFKLMHLASNSAYKTNNDRVRAREELLPQIRELFLSFSRDALLAKLNEAAVAFAPIARPEDLLEDEHLNANGSLLDLVLPNGNEIRLPAVPVEMDGKLPGVRLNLRKPGEDTADILEEIGITQERIHELGAQKIVQLEGNENEDR
ncbi:CaiB/BaiF CoA transferase family protein [Hirschia baltica]|uniref:L-carnitine dehydratase/bile acid-inducible protein F n=1 Tax=Hirschia baltica (strain ATCC 49814 / DSM 5838 / IFAM 1418) TaxID=582402 RepID=C6XJA4_HIRBI|nr:CaiB/BaiF CoA-transferase family protein [Hirschia baltica]ACT59199.1 L-carnitine dehydratase/bile acid-inducible protein F [Hirschia baltica ATCC 49814]